MFSRLTERGVRVDVTVEPGRAPAKPPKDEPARGLLPDYRAVPSGPYRSVPRPSRPGSVLSDGSRGPAAVQHAGKAWRRWPLSPETTPSRFVPRLAADCCASRRR